MILWEIRGNDLWLFKDGRHIGTISKDSLPHLILSAAQALKS